MPDDPTTAAALATRIAMTAPTLSKSKYLAGCQCPRRVWLSCRAPELGTPPDAAKQAIFDSGHEIGRRAHALFPGGVLVSQQAWEHREAVEQHACAARGSGRPRDLRGRLRA